MNLLFNALGVMGTICFLVAFFLLQKKSIASDSYTYLLLNLAGAVLLMISLTWEWNFAAFLLEAAWCLITLYGLLCRYRMGAT